ncbi:MAG: holo-ACP synthase [Thiomonas sp.]|uniref:holo-ACP synthase n=1 Tax=Thiomonas sp. TaxID=2047785 RepID=UPI002A358FEB|nr:holo-ACP synthase [Thiomonas sp.]MDY0329651.1 holo-ACP synthase [Thiomonas sp.]
MIYGIGTDVCSISRMDAAVQRNGDRLAQRVLGADELVEYHRRKALLRLRGIHYLATRFAAKEAFSKSIGLGIHGPMRWRDCEILKRPSGQPVIVLHDALKDWCEARQLRFHVSVSDEADTALAMVVAEVTVQLKT